MEDLPKHQISDLLNRITQGDDQAVGVLYRHYHRSVYAFIRHLVPVDEAVGEILNDTFLVMCRKPGAFNGTSKFHTWLCGIARNKGLDWLRRHGRETTMQQIDQELLESIPDHNGSVLEILEKEEIDDVLRECIDRLPLAQREAIHWTWHEEQTMEVVSEQLGCPLGTLKSRLHHARLKIRDCIEKAMGKGARND